MAKNDFQYAVFYPGTFWGGGGISPQTSNSPPPRTWGEVCYYVNEVSLLSAQN